MVAQLVVVVPSEPASQSLALRWFVGIPLFLRTVLTAAQYGESDFILIAPSGLRRPIIKAWSRLAAPRQLTLHFINHDHPFTDAEVQEIRALTAPQTLWLSTNLLITPDTVAEVLDHNIPPALTGAVIPVDTALLTAAEEIGRASCRERVYVLV